MNYTAKEDFKCHHQASDNSFNHNLISTSKKRLSLNSLQECEYKQKEAINAE